MSFAIKGKSYCVSQCFKDKISKKMKILYEILGAIVILVAVVVGTVLGLTLFGLVLQAIDISIYGHINLFDINPLEAGSKFVGITAFLVFILFITYGVITTVSKCIWKLYRNVSNNVQYVFGRPKDDMQLECSIFEECKE